MNISKVKRRIGMSMAAAALVVGGVIGASVPAQAATYQPIDQLNSPGNYGYLSAQITWNDIYSFDINGANTLRDVAADGHGPYLHIYASDRDAHANVRVYNRLSACDIHNTSGAFTDKSVASCYGITTPNLYAISVWVCNGGNASGYAADGCYGRVYFNKNMDPNRGSKSLGTRTQTYGYEEVVV